MALEKIAAICGLATVALGAFGAHALDGHLSEEAASWWDTATLYALTHAVAALAIGISTAANSARQAGWLFIAGVLVFSGSLYAMALGAPTWFGAITPIGGTALLLGWARAAISATGPSTQVSQQ